MIYNAKEVEERIKKFWEKEKIYSFSLKNKKKIYSIDTPPPTVSGKMHVGHAFSYSQQDFIARYKRMSGWNVYYPFGTDDNGLPTERLVEKLNNVKSKDMPRGEFIKLCLKTLKKITPNFIQDWKNLGISADYEISYSTINENSRRISQKSFIELYKKGEIYRKDFPTIWCPECQTSIAQAELEDKKQTTLLSTLKFKVEGKDLLIATTRPELLPACVAVFVNPSDKRYSNLIGKKAKVPLFNYEVPIIKDKLAEINKGTGVLMVCSYGDKYDVEAINKYKLKPRIIFNKDGTLNFGKYKAMKIKEARKEILKELKEKRLIKEQRKIENIVNVHDKCGTEIEFLPTEQWFIKILDKKKKLIEQGKKIKWYPEFMFKRYENWIKGLGWDWNISRDRYFGVPIPVWYCDKCNKVILADEKELPVDPMKENKKCPLCGKDAKPEKKVLDTWATSSLTPQIVLSLINNKLTIPMSLRPQAHDIIRTWAFYTIVRSYLQENKIPWKNVMVSGFVTLNGEKMSKSKGNVVDPKKILNDYGADALRFSAAGAKLGEDLDYQEHDLIAGKKFLTKLWNASNFVFMNLKDYDFKKPKELQEIDKLFLEKVNDLIKKTTDYFERYEYSKVRSEVENFFWHVFCDDYLEIVKKRVYNEKGDKKLSAQYTLYNSLLSILKLIAPIMPFITEEIFQKYFRKEQKFKSIHVSDWPVYKTKINKDKEVWDLFIDILHKIRKIKSEKNLSMKKEINLTLENEKLKKLQLVLDDLKAVTNAKEIKKGNFDIEII